MKSRFAILRLAAVVQIATLLFTCRAADPAAERAAKAGEFLTINGHRVLRLYSDDIKERGFAHGYFLANDIHDFDQSFHSLPGFSFKRLDSELKPWAKEKFIWDKDAQLEFDGIYEGMRARLGEEGMFSKVMNRAWTRDDLLAVNVIADYFGPACSGFAAWGAMTTDSGVLHARTLDFPLGPRAVAVQVIFACEALPQRNADQPARLAFAAIGWPGMTAQYSGINSKGMTLCIHDGYNVRKGREKTGFMPRGLLIRRVLEGVDPTAGHPAEDAAKIIEKMPVACGNLFQITFPSTTPNQDGFSAVLEFDPSDRKPVIRRGENSALVLTNHFCNLNKPRDCERFKHISGGLDILRQNQRKVGLLEARKLMMSAEQPAAAHSVYMYPDTMEINIAIAKENIMSPHVFPTKFTFKELFR